MRRGDAGLQGTEAWACRGPFGFAQGRLFDSAERFALRIVLLRSG